MSVTGSWKREVGCTKRKRIQKREGDLKGRVLRGPAVIVFILRDTCSDSIANSVVLVFMGYRTDVPV